VIRVVAIQFNHAGKMYDFNAGDLELQAGDRVVVDTERGAGLGTVVAVPAEKDPALFPNPLAMVRRLLGPDDEKTLIHHAQCEQEAREFCLRRIKERAMDMKLVRVEYLFDGSKAIFYFTADGRVDFRELVKDLAHTFHTRIEMRQIGVRDEAKNGGRLGNLRPRTVLCLISAGFPTGIGQDGQGAEPGLEPHQDIRSVRAATLLS